MDRDEIKAAKSAIVIKTEPDMSDNVDDKSDNVRDDIPHQEDDEPFPFERLPAELRRMIIGYAIPQNLSFRFTTSRGRKSSRDYNVQAKGVGRATGFVTLIYGNALPIFFNGNEFSFYVSNRKHDHDTVFGPFGAPHLQKHLREMKTIRLVLNVYPIIGYRCWRKNYHRERIQQFVNQLKWEIGDELKGSRLQYLNLGLAEKGVDSVYKKEVSESDSDNDTYLSSEMKERMFSFEPLAELRHNGTIKEVNITGVPSWFARCLQTCITAKGGDLFPIRWLPEYGQIPEGIGQPTRSTDCTRSVDDPLYDWGEFGRRNKILSVETDEFEQVIEGIFD